MFRFLYLTVHSVSNRLLDSLLVVAEVAMLGGRCVRCVIMGTPKRRAHRSTNTLRPINQTPPIATYHQAKYHRNPESTPGLLSGGVNIFSLAYCSPSLAETRAFPLCGRFAGRKDTRQQTITRSQGQGRHSIHLRGVKPVWNAPHEMLCQRFDCVAGSMPEHNTTT